MKVRCDRNELAERLQAVGGIVPSGPTTKPVLTNFLLRASDDVLMVEATDLDLSARVQVERVEVESPGILALPASRLQALVREIPAATVGIEGLEDSRGALLSSDGYEFRLLGDDPAEFPQLEAFAAEGALVVSREKFVEALRRVSVAASRDQGRFQLTGVFCEVEGEKVTLTATDGKRLTNDVLRVENPSGVQISAIVPNRAVDVLGRVLATGDDTFQLAFSETEVQASFGYGQLMGKLVEGKYPEYRTAIPEEKKTKVSARRTDLMSAVKSASLVTDRETATVVFRFEDDSAWLETHASEIGDSKIRVPVTLEGESLEIRFNPVYFIDALRTVNEEQIRMEFCGSDRPGTIRGGVHYRHLLMPLVVG